MEIFLSRNPKDVLDALIFQTFDKELGRCRHEFPLSKFFELAQTVAISTSVCNCLSYLAESFPKTIPRTVP
jgi:hypothetical protein